MFFFRNNCSSGVEAFMTDRLDGVGVGCYSTLNLGLYSGDDTDTVIQNRTLLCEALKIPLTHLFVPKEVHGDRIIQIDNQSLLLPVENRDSFLECDAMFTTLPNVCLGVTTADCVPILIYNREATVVAAVHAGWKGVVKEIVPKTIDVLQSALNMKPNSLKVMVNACISQKNFEVGEEVAACFDASVVDRINYAKPHVDLRKSVLDQILQAGVEEQNILVSNDCTYDNQSFFSARRDGFASGRLLSGIIRRE